MRSLFHSRDRGPATVVEPVPTIFPVIDGVDIAAVFVGKRIAGDFYDSIRVGPQRTLIGLLDAAGRRDDNRHILTAAQDVFRNVGPQLFSAPDVNESEAMTELCIHINRRLIEVCCGVHSCPAFIACYHEQFGTLCYTNAGHTAGLLRDRSGISELASTGLPLGLFSHATSDAPTVALGNGSALLLVSRGVITCEAHRRSNHSGEFGLNGVKQLFQTAALGSAQALCKSILNAVDEFGGNAPLCDDRTALALIRSA